MWGTLIQLGFIEWVLIVEAVLLATAGLYTGIAFAISRDDPLDPMVVFHRTFWKVFVERQAARSVQDTMLSEEFHEQQTVYDVAPDIGHTDLSAALDDFLPSEDDEGKPKPAPRTKTRLGGEAPVSASAATSQIIIRLVPFAEKENILGRRGSAVLLEVPGAPEDGSSNKSALVNAAKVTGVMSHQVTLLGGQLRARKVLKVTGLSQSDIEAALDKLPRKEAEAPA